LEVRWIPFPLHPETPAEGRELEELFAGWGTDVGRMMATVRAAAKRFGLPMGERTRTFNSRLAQELGEWAANVGRGKEYRAAVYHAYFARGRNIGSPEVLLRAATEAGLDPDAARVAIEQGRFRAPVDDAWARARREGITAVPTHVYRGRRAAGCLPYEELLAFLGVTG
jgi:predicted DsbA family dithiol-disulfide isomerase